jgi:predicted acetyltransferase
VSGPGRAVVTLDAATERDALLLASLLHLYAHDLSAVFALDPGADGRFAYDRLPLYWSEPERRFAFLVRADGRVAGFALVTRGSPGCDDPQALDVAEFFVLRRHRRSRVGTRAAALLWDRFPASSWVVRVAEGNADALPFWRAAIRAYAPDGYTEMRLPGHPQPWRVLRFTSPPAPATR